MRRGLVASLVAGIVLTASGSGAAGTTTARWVITDLGTLGGKESQAFAVNDRGQVVGYADTARKGASHAFLWQGGKMRDLGVLARGSGAADINARGQIVGWSDTGAKTGDGDSIGHAVLWQNGKMRDLSPTAKLAPLSCYSSRDAESLGTCAASGDSINDRGQVLVSMFFNGSGNLGIDRAFVWQNGRLIDLGGLSEWETEASAINDRGQVVGRTDTTARDEDDNPIGHAFLWQNGRMTDLGGLGGNSAAADINGHGQIAGGSEMTATDQAGNGLCHPVLWQGDKTIDLGTPPAGKNGWAEAINERGEIAGVGSRSCAGDSSSHGFLWRNGRMTDLGPIGFGSVVAISERGQVIGNLVPSADSRSTAFVWQNGKMTKLGSLGGNSEARAINDRNQIVGYSTTRAGRTHAALWTLRPG